MVRFTPQASSLIIYLFTDVLAGGHGFRTLSALGFENFPLILVHFYGRPASNKRSLTKEFISDFIFESDNGAFVL
jgi:hypothetical protein